MSKRRRVNGVDMVDNIQQMITLQRNESKDKRPFQTIYCINNMSGVINQQTVNFSEIKKPLQQSSNAGQDNSKTKFYTSKEVLKVDSTSSVQDFKLDSHQQVRMPISETKDNLRSRLSPHRLSQITEKSADDHITVNNNQSAPRRFSGGACSRRSSSQGCQPHARDNSDQRVSSI